MNKVKIAATQMTISWDYEAVLAKAEKMIRDAAAEGANIILLQELFETPYFCQIEDYKYHNLAKPMEGHPMLEKMCALAKELGVVLPVSFFEDAGIVRFNSVAVIDADGTIVGKYRKTHIPDDPGYYEKFYFTPGDTGFRVFDTKYGRLGIGICYDQWYPETARILAMLGADFIFYPTAVGSYSVPADQVEQKSLHYDLWENVMLGHAAANQTPVIVSNRIGNEYTEAGDMAMRFYGGSFISDNQGHRLCALDGDNEGMIIQEFDLDELRAYKQWCGLFRDRRPEMYAPIMTVTGKVDDK